MNYFAGLLMVFALVLGNAGCSAEGGKQNREAAVMKTVPVAGCTSKQKAEQTKMGVAWYRTSGEARALYYQGYNIGKQRMEESLKTKVKKKRAIVLDLDETVLDNGPYLSYMAEKGISFGSGWGAWVKKAKAKPLPGALSFLKYADKKGIDIYYISNRDEKYMDATLRNLKKEGIPQAVRSHVLLQKGTSSKETRRQVVEKDHDIIALFGDNLGDFFKTFDGKGNKARSLEADRFRHAFGRKFIVFPNPVYGDWEHELPCGS
ncbi:5'-nucleotidase, lipoprotein e(P4) family [Heyndrickxia coagulans]|uniref:5'-nucleotidase, lipoprotein e(P4) family n=1 Tax=Heyndrickxia coagulans TaxID=1398 RepID=UPI00281209B4|nr:5'-nucleotidase, lipoprotein e(P4) family [Heyndrickxia coagulans]WMM89555.1 5'-nucleotidase, lipoprotein e(P4) family [Heyndrickxia coagulans]